GERAPKTDQKDVRNRNFIDIGAKTPEFFRSTGHDGLCHAPGEPKLGRCTEERAFTCFPYLTVGNHVRFHSPTQEATRNAFCFLVSPLPDSLVHSERHGAHLGLCGTTEGHTGKDKCNKGLHASSSISLPGTSLYRGHPAPLHQRPALALMPADAREEALHVYRPPPPAANGGRPRRHPCQAAPPLPWSG